MDTSFQNKINQTPNFQNHEDEIKFLRQEVAKRETELSKITNGDYKKELTHEVVKDYANSPVAQTLSAEVVMSSAEIEEVFKKLKPEIHDNKIKELFNILETKGVRNALQVLAVMDDPHLENDFHKLLVRYIHDYEIKDVKKDSELYKVLHMRLFEVTIPRKDGDEKRSYKELLQAMEQFYMGMMVLSNGKYGNKDYFTIEIAKAQKSKETVFYFCIPDEVANLFEKQLAGAYIDVKIREILDDYNVYIQGGNTIGSVGKLAKEEVFSIRLHDTFDYDPMNSILNSFSKLDKETEGVAVQFVINPVVEKEYSEKYNSILKKVKKGAKVKDVIDDWAEFKKESISAIKSLFSSSKNEEEKKDEDKFDPEIVRKIEDKMKWIISPINLRIVVSSSSQSRSEQIMAEIKSSFNQFTEPGSNSVSFQDYKGNDLKKLLHEYTFRNYDDAIKIPLNIRELTTLVHLPFGVESSSELREARAGIAPAPLNMGTEGILIGHNDYRGTRTEIRFKKEDRMRHFYTIGQTGTGKTNSLMNMIVQDIANGDGVCYIDPHGTDIQTILSLIPKERLDDVIYFDPAFTARPMALNMLEYDVRFPEQKSIVIDTLMMIFNQLFSKESMGPQFEQYFKNAAFLVMDDPESGSTLLEITRVFTDKEFRDFKLSKCKNPIVKNFWVSAEATTGESGLQNYVPYITSKFDQFISNEFLRPIILQQKSTFNFRDIMDNKKIFLVNLSKGRLGEMNANLIGMLCVMKFQMAALSRVDSYGKKLEDFFLYIDEFQNVTTPAIASILSEARKYRLSLNVAHQYLSQLPEEIKNAVFGNVGSMAVFRISPDDAKYLEPKFAPTFTAEDIIKIENYNAYLTMIIDGQPSQRPFNVAIPQLPNGNKEIVDDIKQLSYLKFGEDRAMVEEEIFGRFSKNR